MGGGGLQATEANRETGDKVCPGHFSVGLLLKDGQIFLIGVILQGLVYVFFILALIHTNMKFRPFVESSFDTRLFTMLYVSSVPLLVSLCCMTLAFLTSE